MSENKTNTPVTPDFQFVWHPCRHKLPAYDERVLVACRGTNSNWRGVQIGRRISTSKAGEHWNDDSGQPMKDNVVVYAWTPLPKADYEE